MKLMKKCTVCDISKPLDEFHNDKSRKDGKFPHCKKCKEKYRCNHPEIGIKSCIKYRKTHVDVIRERRRQKSDGHSMYENKKCSHYLGIVIGERLVRHLFNNVEVMPFGNLKFDFICNRGKKIDVKTKCMYKRENGNIRWKFQIKKNKIADFFILVAFDNRNDLNPLHLWMIPGNEINHQNSLSISVSTIHKWDKWKRDINDAQICCAEMKTFHSI